MAYTVKSGDNWFSISQKVYGSQIYAARLRDRNRGVTLSPGVRIKTRGIATGVVGGGQALATFAGISPAGVAPTPGEVPGVTAAGGLISPVPAGPASTELVSLLPPGGVSPQQLVSPLPPEEVSTEFDPMTVADTTTTRKGRRPYRTEVSRPPVELTPQALTPGPEQLVPWKAPLPPPIRYPQRPLPEQIVMGEGSPGYQPLGLAGVPARIAEAFQEAFQEPFGLGGATTQEPELVPAPVPAPVPETEAAEFVPQELPPPRYPYGTTSAAHYTARAMSNEYDADGNLIREGQLVGAISPGVADMLGMSNQMLVNAGYVWDEASGLWHLQPQQPTITTTGGGGGRRRRGRRGRRGSGGGQSPYGSGFNSNVGGLINWRRGFGG